MNKRAIVLLSGGLDSTTLAHFAVSEGYEVYAMSFRYGQRHSIELDKAVEIASRLGVADHVIVDFDLRLFGGSALTDEIEVPKHNSVNELSAEIPATYVPARNTIFLSFALAWAESLGIGDIFIGVNALDYAGYPDCRPEFIAAFQKMANLATKCSVSEGNRLKIHTPLIDKNKTQIIQLGLSLGADYSITSSCYNPTADGLACGHCDSCLLRLQGFAECGLKDPVEYSAGA